MQAVSDYQKAFLTFLESQSFLKEPENLYAPISYIMGLGGKRLRPILALMGCDAYAAPIQKAMPVAVAIEVFHNFTLLHDDIMDKAEMRRNKETVHIKYSENSAILSGDAMAFLSYKYILESKSQRLVDVIDLFSTTAIEVCEGQQYDMDFESRLDVSENEYLEMIRLKTAVLLACSLKAGALLANSDDNTNQQLYEFGLNLGLAFQLQDDYLDSFGNVETFGKKIGGDILSNKKTYLLINALEKASGTQKTELLTWLKKTKFNPQEKIKAIKAIYHNLEIEKLILAKIDTYFQKASKNLAEIKLPDVIKQELQFISRRMLKRNH